MDRFFCGVYNHGFHRFKVNQLDVGEAEREPSHFTQFIPVVKFVGVAFLSSQNKLYDMLSSFMFVGEFSEEVSLWYIIIFGFTIGMSFIFVDFIDVITPANLSQTE